MSKIFGGLLIFFCVEFIIFTSTFRDETDLDFLTKIFAGHIAMLIIIALASMCMIAIHLIKNEKP